MGKMRNYLLPDGGLMRSNYVNKEYEELTDEAYTEILADIKKNYSAPVIVAEKSDLEKRIEMLESKVSGIEVKVSG